MITPDQYQAKAAYCRCMAEKVFNAADREAWLKLAGDWQSMAAARKQSAADHLQASERAHAPPETAGGAEPGGSRGLVT